MLSNRLRFWTEISFHHLPTEQPQHRTVLDQVRSAKNTWHSTAKGREITFAQFSKDRFDGIFQHLSTRDAYMRQWTRSLSIPPGSIPSTAQWFVYSAKRNSQDRWPLLLTWINSTLARISNHMPCKVWVSARISNHMPSKVWDEITNPFLNFNGRTIEV